MPMLFGNGGARRTLKGFMAFQRPLRFLQSVCFASCQLSMFSYKLGEEL